MFFGGLFIAFLIAEIIVRVAGHFDINGNFWVYSFRCYPYRIPYYEWIKTLDEYTASENSALIYDAFLGWSPRPGSQSKNGKYLYNNSGIRASACESLISKTPENDVLRIAIFGDSFTHGDDVPFENTWGYFLESNLKEAGIKAEVLNFGMCAYGMDQALLRWRRTGYLYEPEIVIFGLQIENINRNVNIARPIYYPNTKIPFLKPRFILKKDELSLINIPTPSPDKIPDIAKNFTAWEYSKYEYWYDKNCYRDNLFFRSKLISFCYTLLDQKILRNRFVNREDKEALSLAIVSAFKADVESKGKKFFVLYLPLNKNLNSTDNAFISEVSKITDMINTQHDLSEEADKSGLKTLIPGHYSANANKIAADVCAAGIIAKIKSTPQSELLK